MKTVISILLLASSMCAQIQSFAGDWLNESPLTPIPADMTFEEYRDMNRRLTVGLALAAIPIPGLIHDYADEKKTAKRIRRIALGSVGLIVAGALVAGASDDEGEWQETDYKVHVEGKGDSELRYAMIPTGMIGNTVTYDLKPLYRERGGGGGGILIILGVGLLVADVIYDVYHGVRIIEEKRDAVRYKYGKQLKFSYTPEMNIQNHYAGLKMSYDF